MDGFEAAIIGGSGALAALQRGCVVCGAANVRQSSHCFRRRIQRNPNYASDGGDVTE